jgi:hypothetical protein
MLTKIIKLYGYKLTSVAIFAFHVEAFNLCHMIF